MAKRKAVPKGEVAEARRGIRNPDQRTFERPIVPIETINAAANELRADHPKVTDEQAAFVHLLIQTGQSIPNLCAASGATENWAYYHMAKSHVADYRQAVAIRTLGWDSAAALATMRSLLHAKSDYIRLEAARDLLDRGGLSLEPVRSTGSPVVMNFNLAPTVPVQEPLEVDVTIEMGPIDPGHSPRGAV